MEEEDEYVLSDDDEDAVVNIPVSGGVIAGMVHVNGEKLNWADMKDSPQRLVYVFDGISGLRFYITGQVVDGFLKLQTELI